MSTIFKFLPKNYPYHLSTLSKDFPSIYVDLSLGHITEMDIKNLAYIFLWDSGLPNLNKMEDF